MRDRERTTGPCFQLSAGAGFGIGQVLAASTVLRAANRSRRVSFKAASRSGYVPGRRRHQAMPSDGRTAKFKMPYCIPSIANSTVAANKFRPAGEG
jgi:hypothetical protein